MHSSFQKPNTLTRTLTHKGGWVGRTGSNNYPLRGSKVSDFEGGVRAVAFLSGGYLPISVRGGRHTGYIHVADWYGTLAKLVGVDPSDNVPGLPPVDSNDFWPSVLVPNATSTGREVCIYMCMRYVYVYLHVCNVRVFLCGCAMCVLPIVNIFSSTDRAPRATAHDSVVDTKGHCRFLCILSLFFNI